MISSGSLASIHRYPVKSMMGEALESVQMTRIGLMGDRAYALCDAETGKVVSAKNPLKWPNIFTYHACFTKPFVAGSDVPPVRVTLPDGSSALSSSPDFAPKLSTTLGRSVSLLSTPPQNPELEEYWPDMEELSNRNVVTDEKIPEGTFFDLGTLHLLTTSTLVCLGELNPQSRFESRRFRPNLIVDTGDSRGFVENDWVGKTLSIGPDVRIHVTGPCPRCVMTTLAQGDLPKDPAILKTAAKYNQARVGVYASVVQTGRLSVGDPVTILN
ncbi:MAG TPA: MOSC N-terminal beta barrel domain-containing protein [Candidatus Aquilonibacter sp.]|nr:MOSC N-terminal beta barrel domain-containing protein [Candidatus Aquilonibacter sp.]